MASAFEERETEKDDPDPGTPEMDSVGESDPGSPEMDHIPFSERGGSADISEIELDESE